MVMTMDADLQDDPREIPRFLAAMENNLDVVSGWKLFRHDPWHKVGPSRVFNALVSGLTGVKLHDHNCGMKCYRREVLGEVRLYGELHRFVPVLAAGRGLSRGRDHDQPPPAEVRPVEIRLHAVRQGLSRPAHGEVPHRLCAASAAPARHDRPVMLRGGLDLGRLAGGLLGHFPAAHRHRPGGPARKDRAALRHCTACWSARSSCRWASWPSCSSPTANRTCHRTPFWSERRNRRTRRSRGVAHPELRAKGVISGLPRPSLEAQDVPPNTMHENLTIMEIPGDATLRRSIYALLICIGVGAAIGRILAVDSVDMVRLADYQARHRRQAGQKTCRQAQRVSIARSIGPPARLRRLARRRPNWPSQPA